MDLLRALNPKATRREAVAVLKEWLGLPSLPPPLSQLLLTQLIEILQSYAASQLKPETVDRSNVFQSEPVAEMALGKTRLQVPRCLRAVHIEVMNRVLEGSSGFDMGLFWTVFHHLLNLLCLNHEQASNEVRLGTLKCMGQLLKAFSTSSEAVSHEALQQRELSNSLAFAVCKCLERIHEEHPKGEKEIAQASFGVLQRLLDVFSLPALWFGILPSTASEISAFLACTGRMVENREAVLPWSRITVDAIRLFSSMSCCVLADRNVIDLKPVHSEETPSLEQLYGVIQLHADAPSTSIRPSVTPAFGKKAPAIEGSWEWFQFSGLKIAQLMKKWMPSLQHHPRAAVRSALAEGVHQLLEECQVCLESSLEDLLRTQLSLSQDPYPQAHLAVTQSCQRALESFKMKLTEAPLEDASINRWHVVMESLMKKEIASMSEAITHSAAKIQSTAQILTAAVRLIEGPLFSSWIVEDIFQLQLLYEGWHSAFSFDPILINTLCQTSTLPGADRSAKDTLKMPLALKYITEEDTYRALSQSIHVISASLCSTSDTASKGFQLLIDACLDGIGVSCELVSDCGYLPVASSISLFSEVLYGARACSASLLVPSISHVAHLMHQHDPWKLCSEAERVQYREGEHAFLVHCLLKWVEVCGIVLKRHLLDAACGILPLVLLPVIEKSVDPLPLLQSTAQNTLKALFDALELPSRSDLILKCAPCIIEGLCLKLSDVTARPRSPNVLAALLRDLAEKPGELLPLLSTPVSHALRGVSIQGRGLSPEHILPYLEALSEATAVVQRVTESVFSYLQRYAGTSDVFSDAIASEVLDQMQHLKSAAIIADSIVHLTTPLFLDPHLYVCQLALRVCAVGVMALRSATSACRFFDDRLSPRFPKTRPEASMATPEIPQISSVITPVWRNLLAALKRHPVVMVEGSLELFISVATAFDGRTLSRRFTEEAWPLLKTLLKQGYVQPPPHAIIPHRGSFIAVHNTPDLAPQSRERAQLAALDCLRGIGEDPVARPCLKVPLAEIVELLISLLSQDHPLSIQESVKRTIGAIAVVDVDYVWSILREATRQPPQPHFQELLRKVGSAEVAWHRRLRERYFETAAHKFT